MRLKDTVDAFDSKIGVTLMWQRLCCWRFSSGADHLRAACVSSWPNSANGYESQERQQQCRGTNLRENPLRRSSVARFAVTTANLTPRARSSTRCNSCLLTSLLWGISLVARGGSSMESLVWKPWGISSSRRMLLINFSKRVVNLPTCCFYHIDRRSFKASACALSCQTPPRFSKRRGHALPRGGGVDLGIDLDTNATATTTTTMKQHYSIQGAPGRWDDDDL